MFGFCRYSAFSLHQAVSSNGIGPCFLNLDWQNGFIHAADYDGSTFTSYELDKESSELEVSLKSPDITK